MRDIAFRVAQVDGRRRRHARHQFRLDGAGPAAPRARRPGPGAPARPQLGRPRRLRSTPPMTGTTVTQLRDDIYLVNVVARATAEQRLSLDDAARAAGAGAGRPHRGARHLRQLRLRAGIPADLAARPRADPDGAGRRGAGRAAGSGGLALAPGIAGIAATLPKGYRIETRRHRRGERALARLGLRRGAADAGHHVHRADGPAAELRPARPGDRHPAARPDRRGRGAAARSASRSASSPSSASSRCSA